VNDKPEKDHHWSAGKLGSQTVGLADRSFHIPTIDSAPNFADHDHCVTVPLPFSVEIHLDFLPVHCEETAAKLGNADAIMLSEVSRSNLPRQVL